MNGAEERTLTYQCKACGYSKVEETGGLIMETAVQEQASDSYKVYLNEYTLKDPTLPHTKTLKCPHDACASNGGGAVADPCRHRLGRAGLFRRAADRGAEVLAHA